MSRLLEDLSQTAARGFDTVEPPCRNNDRPCSGVAISRTTRHIKVLGITRCNLHGQAWPFGALLGEAA